MDDVLLAAPHEHVLDGRLALQGALRSVLVLRVLRGLLLVELRDDSRVLRE